MMIVLIIVLVLVVGGLVAVVTGRLGTDTMSDAGSTSPFELPDGPIGARGADAVRFDQALRGYNMGQVDAVLDRLFDEIAQLESRLGERTPHERHRGRDTDDPAVGTLRRTGDEEAGSTDAEVVQFRQRATNDPPRGDA